MYAWELANSSRCTCTPPPPAPMPPCAESQENDGQTGSPCLDKAVPARGNQKVRSEKPWSDRVAVLSHNPTMVVTLWHHTGSISVHVSGKRRKAMATVPARWRQNTAGVREGVQSGDQFHAPTQGKRGQLQFVHCCRLCNKHGDIDKLLRDVRGVGV